METIRASTSTLQLLHVKHSLLCLQNATLKCLHRSACRAHAYQCLGEEAPGLCGAGRSTARGGPRLAHQQVQRPSLMQMQSSIAILVQ